ncbi:unnamed protein product, partial [Allacma fusca]
FAGEGKTAKFQGVAVPLLKPNEKLEYLEISDSPKIIKEPYSSRISFLTKLNVHEI